MEKEHKEKKMAVTREKRGQCFLSLISLPFCSDRIRRGNEKFINKNFIHFVDKKKKKRNNQSKIILIIFTTNDYRSFILNLSTMRNN